VKEKLLEILYSANNTPLGICVEVNDAERLRQKLYALRREYKGEFEQLAFLISPLNGADLWILNKEKADGPE